LFGATAKSQSGTKWQVPVSPAAAWAREVTKTLIAVRPSQLSKARRRFTAKQISRVFSRTSFIFLTFFQQKAVPDKLGCGLSLCPCEKSRLSGYKQARLIEHFVAGTTASLFGVNRKMATFYFHRLREIVAFELEAESEAMFVGETEVGESDFGGNRKGKRGRGAARKIPVFSLLKHGGKAYTKVTLDADHRAQIVPDSIVYSDS